MGEMGIGATVADVTSQLYLWDAGTEADEPVGERPNQAPRQAGPNTGPADTDNTVRQVLDGPAVTDLVRVTIAPVEPTVFAVHIRNIRDPSMVAMPFSPGVFVVHSAPYVLFEEGKPSYDYGLEALAEDGHPNEIVAALPPTGPSRRHSRFANGRRPYLQSILLRVHVFQIAYNLSQPAMAEILVETPCVRHFKGVQWQLNPDESTILRSRQSLNQHALGDDLLVEINHCLSAQGYRL